MRAPFGGGRQETFLRDSYPFSRPCLSFFKGFLSCLNALFKGSHPLFIKENDRKDEAFSFVIVPTKSWAPKRESPIVSLFGAHGSLLRQP